VRRTPIIGLLLSFTLAIGATGCGGGGDDDAGGGDATTTTSVTGADGSSTTVADGSSSTLPGDDGSGTEEGGATTATTAGNGTGGTDTSTGGDGGGLDASAAAPDMTSGQICTLMPANMVGTALGVRGVVAEPGADTGTPQCSYKFNLDSGQQTDATIAALRSQADMGGRFGADAFDFVVSLNKAAAQDPVTQTPLEVGNQAVLLTGSHLYMAIVQLGGRIVTVLLNTNAGDAGSVTGLAGQTIVLAP
jgi:hypothetical protein